MTDAKHVFETPAGVAEMRAYQDWERRNAAKMRLRYEEFPDTSAFGVRPPDVLMLNPKVSFDFSGAEPRMFDEHGRDIGTLPNVPVELLKQFVAALDGRRSLAAISAEPPFTEHAELLRGMVGALLGGPFLLPAAIERLESELPAVELLRYPSQSPYAMPREYWENSAAVRQALEGFYKTVDRIEAFTNALRGLHRLATLGASGVNYYGGAGGVSTVPGEFRNRVIVNRFNERKKRIFKQWLQLLELPLELVENGQIESTNGVPLVLVRDHGTECHHGYGPDGEALATQLNEVRAELAMMGAAWGDGEKFLRQCALFHHAFVHAHPFLNVNNSIAMNIVNDLLRRAGVGVLPHLYFDQVAYFLEPEAYVQLFRRGFEAHVMNESVGRDRPATRALLEVASAPAPRG